MEDGKTYRFKIASPMMLCFCLMLHAGCETNGLSNHNLECKVNAVDGAQDNVIGKWRLVKLEEVFYNPKVTDYSCYIIIYHFNEEGKLLVSSNIEENIIYEPGEYDYSFNIGTLYEGGEENYTLKISSINWACGIQESNMALNNAPVDGPKLYFVRIE